MTCKRAVFYLHGVASPQSTNRRPENVEVSALLSVADVFHYDATGIGVPSTSANKDSTYRISRSVPKSAIRRSAKT